MSFFFLWVAASFVVGSMAPGRNRSYVNWTVLSLLISPLIAVLCLVAAGTRPARVIEPAPKRDPLAGTTRARFDREPVPIGDRIEDGRRLVRNSSWGPPAFLGLILLVVWGVSRVVGGAPEAPPLVLQSMRGPLVIVPAPNPASRGILLDAWARSHAPLVPLN
jgi:hypothetical protein